jgi:predicted transcriptional regulator
MESEREELRQVLAKLGPRGRGKRYPKDLLTRLAAYGRARREQGATMFEIGSELGVTHRVVERWLREAGKMKRFRRVQIIGELPKQRVTVRGPHGLVVEGLDIAALADLLRKLGA